eukprot:8655402-Pyramimonas_sp.AAC.1
MPIVVTAHDLGAAFPQVIASDPVNLPEVHNIDRVESVYMSSSCDKMNSDIMSGVLEARAKSLRPQGQRGQMAA